MHKTSGLPLLPATLASEACIASSSSETTDTGLIANAFPRRLAFCLLVALASFSLHSLVAGPVRDIPRPLPLHPGNIFVAGENVTVAVTPGDSEKWRVVDYEGKVVAKGILKNDKAEVGPLPVGWYKVVRGEAGQITNRVFLGVLEPLRAPTPTTSPICMDLGMAWFFPAEDKMREVVSLCQLAGFNWVRDRLMWSEMEPKRGEFAASTRYDSSAKVQSEAGLQVLQVSHISAPWANPNGKRFPLDLRDAYNFWRETARRWNGKVGAFEPWNEADISVFGGHTGSEMATLQKASYLGLKAGNPDAIACLNVFAIRRAATLSDFNANQAWPYFDTYNLHHYEPLENYASLYADHRAVSAGKPIWTSECSVRVKWKGDEHLKELSEQNLRLQSERVTKTYVKAIHEGVKNVFYFVLPHYSESQLQYGLLRGDLTPRPGYIAAAAAGRLLADAKPLGRLDTTNGAVEGFLFDTKADGKQSDVLVIWSTNTTTFTLPKTPLACFDHLGRKRDLKSNVLDVSSTPLYVVLSNDAHPSFVAPPRTPKLLTGKPSPIILQALLPEEDTVLEQSAQRIDRGAVKTVPMFVYNFGSTTARGRLRVKAPDKWKAELSGKVEIAPGERKELTVTVTSPSTEDWTDAAIRITGDFGRAGEAMLAFRLVPPAGTKQ